MAWSIDLIIDFDFRINQVVHDLCRNCPPSGCCCNQNNFYDILIVLETTTIWDLLFPRNGYIIKKGASAKLWSSFGCYLAVSVFYATNEDLTGFPSFNFRRVQCIAVADILVKPIGKRMRIAATVSGWFWISYALRNNSVNRGYLICLLLCFFFEQFYYAKATCSSAGLLGRPILPILLKKIRKVFRFDVGRDWRSTGCEHFVLALIMQTQRMRVESRGRKGKRKKAWWGGIAEPLKKSWGKP